MIRKQKKYIIAGLVVFLLFFGLTNSYCNAFGLDNPLGGSSGNVAVDAFTPDLPSHLKPMTIEELIARIIRSILGLVGVLTLVFFVWGGMLWMTAAGNDERVKKGKETILWATLGLTVIFASYAILSAIIGVLAGSTIK